jgi:hypothetical protein
MTKSLHQHTKKELVAIIQDYQEAISEVEEIINTLLISDHPISDHPIHTATGLHDIRAAINRHVHKQDCV